MASQSVLALQGNRVAKQVSIGVTDVGMPASSARPACFWYTEICLSTLSRFGALVSHSVPPC